MKVESNNNDSTTMLNQNEDKTNYAPRQHAN